VVQELAKQLKRPAIIPVPSFALRLAFGEAADELLICNQKMNPQKLLDSGFKFSHPDLASACAWVLNKG
jgi:NAD dependent epimerase/dehydratase family enzyme